MGSGDFLRKGAQTPLVERFLMAGVPSLISTNSETILEAARESFCPAEEASYPPRFHLGFWVDPKGTTQPPWPKPFFRGLDHLVFAGFDTQNSILVDLRTCRAIGRFSPSLGSDGAFWKTVIFPVLLSIAGATLGVSELHCGCVTQGGKGLLLVGGSGSGKSTLALALALRGFGYVSDDRTFCSDQEGRLALWGLPTLLKLRPSSADFFPGFKPGDPVIAPNGELALLIDPDRTRGLTRIKRCEPSRLVFLERREGATFDLMHMPRSEAAISLEKDMLAECPAAAREQRTVLHHLLKLPCWKLSYGEPPGTVAEKLARWFADASVDVGAHGRASLPRLSVERQDPLRRFTPTPYADDLPVMGRTLRVEANDAGILDRTRAALARYLGTPSKEPDFLWRIVKESAVQMQPPWPEKSGFSAEGLRFINIGQRSFIAVDLNARVAVAVLAAGLADDAAGFWSPFLDDMFSLTASKLGLAPLFAACVGLGDKGVLVLGPPNSGKTTSSYLATKWGLDFLADQMVFLEIQGGQLRAWGDFLPAAFRPSVVDFLPDVSVSSQPFHYRDLTFLYMEKAPGPPARGVRPIVPVACLFLRRGQSQTPKLAPINRADFGQRLRESRPFRDDQPFERHRAQVFKKLQVVPAYQLAYGSDPAEVLPIYMRLLGQEEAVAKFRGPLGR